MSNNPPYAVIELTEEEYQLIAENAETNIAMALAILPGITARENAERTVQVIEKFKRLRDKLKEARREYR